LLKNILAYCGYSMTSPFFLLLSEHKHCDNAATNSNGENARSRMVASSRRSMVTGTNKDESCTGHVWAVEFHHVMARSRLARILKLMNCLFLLVSKFFSGRSKPRIQGGQRVLQFLHIACFYHGLFKGSSLLERLREHLVGQLASI